ncbi:MAG: hypothetical protein AMQ22_01867 [Candidatus Methanofastidiosum methylothiophilum]|uniref:Copper amine oxidase-like N-terminal domain-containing protein n=1 Tax=Candidatus Methanofastidiosum methylothiophilum TaxID=1705564 RepID=A0A150IU91_9EURY|nr:MAG: hypothetical protein AMQ22_01867 [Candidatus Methanofastidiosum methylthiophilus]
MKRIIPAFIIFFIGGFFILFSKTSPAIGNEQISIIYKIDSIYMTVNGKQVEIDPGRGTKTLIIKEWNRAVVPIRSLVEVMNGTILWDSNNRKVTIEVKKKNVVLFISKPKAFVNGTEVWIDEDNKNVTPIIINGRTMIPLRFIGENIGFTVIWNGKSQLITLLYPQRIIQLESNEVLITADSSGVAEVIFPIKNNNSSETTFNLKLINLDSPKGWFSEYCIKNACYFNECSIILKAKEEVIVQAFIHSTSEGMGEFAFCVSEANRDSECIIVKVKGGGQ